MGACFCVGESMMMICQVKTTMCCHGVQLIILQIREHFERCLISTMELIVRISHLIMCETCFKATLIEVFVVSHKRKVSHIFGSLTPHLREDWRIIGVFLFDSMNFGVPIAVMIWNWFYQAIKTIDNLPVFHNDDADTAGASDIAISRLEIYGCKVREIGNYYLIVRRF